MLDASAHEKDLAARKWLSHELGLNLEVPLLPFTEREERDHGSTWRLRSRCLLNGVAAALFLAGMLFRFMARHEIEVGIEFGLALLALFNFATFWDLKERMLNASKLDRAFFVTVKSGETNLSLWPSFIAGHDQVKSAQEIAQNAERRSRSNASR
jgi:hypothetical protein